MQRSLLIAVALAVASVAAEPYKPPTQPPMSSLPTPSKYPVPTDITIAPDGSGTFKTIQDAVDFIFGKSTAVFENCQIHSKGGGYLTAASTDPQSPWGYVFLHCKLTAEPTVKKGSVFLGRPWRPYAATAFINCEMGEQINPQ